MPHLSATIVMVITRQVIADAIQEYDNTKISNQKTGFSIQAQPVNHHVNTIHQIWSVTTQKLRYRIDIIEFI